MLKRTRGFTLIELLVVIAIIGLLSSIVLASLNVAKIKANDARRSVDINSLSTALSAYYIDHGYLPCVGQSSSNGSDQFSELQPYIDGGYLSSKPKDPINDNNNYYYVTTFQLSSTGQNCDVAEIGVYFQEKDYPDSCPNGGVWSSFGHCHVFVPDHLPSNRCTNYYRIENSSYASYAYPAGYSYSMSDDCSSLQH
ncbi:MAG: type II secretion system protein [Minisyncoccota bacterium]